MITAKALREQRAPLAVRIREMADRVNARESKAWEGDEEANWNALNADYNAFAAAIDRAETADRYDAEQHTIKSERLIGREDLVGKSGHDGASAADTERLRTLALVAWHKTHTEAGGLTAAEREACTALDFDPRAKKLHLQLYSSQDFASLQSEFRQHHPKLVRNRLNDFRATLTGGSGPGGGYLVAPEQLIRSFELNLLAFGPMWQVADVRTTDTGEPMSWPTGDDTTTEGAQLGENASIGSSVDPTFSKVLWSAYVFSSKPVLYPFTLGQDSVFDLPSMIGEMLGVRLARATNRKFTTGTGAATAKGVVTCATLGVTAASSTAIAADEIIRLEHAIDPAYRFDCSYMMHDTILLAIRLLKDGMGRYLWQSGFDSGVPDSLNNWPLNVNQHMASSVATTNKTLLFGQFKRYKIRRVGMTRTYHLQERYRDTDQDALISFLRCDGNLLTAGTSPMVYLVQP
jgi:HK97 family phage major capsid protein